MSIQLGDRETGTSRNTNLRTSRFPGWPRPFVLAAVCGSVGFVVATLLPHSYKVDSSLYFPTQGNDSASAASIIGKVVGGGGGSMGGDSDVGSVSLLGGMFQQPEVASGSQTAIAVLDSVRCGEAVAADLKLAELWHMRKRSDVLAKLDSMVTYGVDKNNLLDIEVVSTDPNLALKISNSYLTNLQIIATQLSTNYSHVNRLFIEQEADKARKNLDLQEAKLVALQTRGGIKTLSNASSEKLAASYVDLEERKVEADIALDGANSQIDQMVRTANATVKNSMELPRDIPVAQDTRNQVRDLEARFAYAKETLGPDNPEYNSLKIQLETTRAQMVDEVKREAGALKMGITPEVAQLYANRANLKAQADGLHDASKRLEDVLRGLPRSQMEVFKVQSDAKIAASTLGMLSGELEKAKIAEERDSPNFMVVDAPELPDSPFAPRKLFVTIVCLAAGFLIGCAWLVADSIRRSGGLADTADEN